MIIVGMTVAVAVAVAVTSIVAVTLAITLAMAVGVAVSVEAGEALAMPVGVVVGFPDYDPVTDVDGEADTDTDTDMYANDMNTGSDTEIDADGVGNEAIFGSAALAAWGSSVNGNPNGVAINSISLKTSEVDGSTDGQVGSEVHIGSIVEINTDGDSSKDAMGTEFPDVELKIKNNFIIVIVFIIAVVVVIAGMVILKIVKSLSLS